jgi:hypothetical protein
VGEKGEVLENRVDLALVGGVTGNVFTVQGDGTGVQGFQARDDAEQGGFAAAGGAQQGKKTIGGNIKVDVLKNGSFSGVKGLIDAFDGKTRVARDYVAFQLLSYASFLPKVKNVLV